MALDVLPDINEEDYAQWQADQFSESARRKSDVLNFETAANQRIATFNARYTPFPEAAAEPPAPEAMPSAPPEPAPAQENFSSLDTQLSPEDEARFQAWKARYAPNDSGEDYDLRGAFQAGYTPNAQGHWPDTFKKPNHPTFSVESRFAQDYPDRAGRWEGDTYIPPGQQPGAPAASTVTPPADVLNPPDWYQAAAAPSGPTPPADVLNAPSWFVGPPAAATAPGPESFAPPAAPSVPAGLPTAGLSRTTAELSGAAPVLGRLSDRGRSILANAASNASWLGPEGQKAVQSVLLTEGGLDNARGDQGQSIGPLQFYGGPEGGQLNSLANYLRLSLKDTAAWVEAHPNDAVAWAIGTPDAPGYLGAAIQRGQQRGLSGADLATYAQRTGQVSVSPERAGQNYDAVFGSGAGPYQPSVQESLERIQAGYGKGQDISQFGDPQLTNDEAYAACGPAAAVRFAQKYGRNPTLREALDLAKTVGWTSSQGMAGIASEKALMDKLGVPTRLVNGAQWDAFAAEAQTGNPITISTSGHYFFADGYDPQTQRFHVGRSGMDLRGGSEWMTAAQMTNLMGPVQGALFADNPQVPAPSTADQTSNPIDWLGRQKDALINSITGGGQPSAQPTPEPTPQPARKRPSATDPAVMGLDDAVDQAAAQPSRPTAADQATQVFGPTAATQSPGDRLKNAFSDFIDMVGGAAGQAGGAIGTTAGNLGGAISDLGTNLGRAVGGGGETFDYGNLGPSTAPGAAGLQSVTDYITGETQRRNQQLPYPESIQQTARDLAAAQSGAPPLTVADVLGGVGSALGTGGQPIGGGLSVEDYQALNERRRQQVEAAIPEDVRNAPVLGGAATMAADVLTDPTTYLLTGPIGRAGRAAEEALGAGLRGSIGNQAVQGALFSALQAAEKPGATPQDIAIAAAEGTALGAGGAVAARGAGLGVEALRSPAVQRFLAEEEGSLTIPSFGGGAKPPTAPAGGPLERTLQMFEENDKQPSKLQQIVDDVSKAIGLRGEVGAIDKGMADRMAAINQVTGRAREALGNRFTPEMDAEAYAAVFPGRFGSALWRVKQDLQPAVDLVGNDLPYLNAYRKLQRDAEVANLRGGTRQASAGIKTAAEAQQGLQEIEDTVGPQRYANIVKADQIMTDGLNQLLDDRVANGLVSADLATALKRDHPHYNPTVVLKYLDDEARLAGSGRRMMTLSNQVRRLAEEGAADNTEAPVRSATRLMLTAQLRMMQNDVSKATIAASMADPQTAPLVQRIPMSQLRTGPEVSAVGGPATAHDIATIAMRRPVADIPGTIAVWEKGKPQLYQVPPEIEEAIKGLGAEQITTVGRVLQALNAPLRAGATFASAPFTVTNMLADAITTFVREGAATTARIPEGWWHAARKDAVFQDYARAGGLMESFAQRQPRDLDKLIRDQGGIVPRNWKDVPRLLADAFENVGPLRRINEVIEQGPHLASYQQGLREGLSPTQATMRGRRVTVDFSRGGNAAKSAS